MSLDLYFIKSEAKKIGGELHTKSPKKEEKEKKRPTLLYFLPYEGYFELSAGMLSRNEQGYFIMEGIYFIALEKVPTNPPTDEKLDISLVYQPIFTKKPFPALPLS